MFMTIEGRKLCARACSKRSKEIRARGDLTSDFSFESTVRRRKRIPSKRGPVGFVNGWW
jgi:hypothetical protein